ncbi:glutamate-rich protein 6-like isoform X1 [Acipenser ruthenus]|uniref:glutamate-rich protein 6-like isoform X1 n=2 Tax=Acipenser ruthenus TaxID=7906 RepID=UPI0027410DB3|nr:glutamate-rich protein 6-like isoform X1 [Acipenser ruthenus]
MIFSGSVMIMHYLLLTRKICLYKGEIQGRKHSEMSKESGHSSCKGRQSAGSESPQPCPVPESLTVENVQRLERQYEADGRYSPEKAVEEYIRQTHLYCTQQRAKSGRTEQREKEGSQGSARAQSLSGAISVGIEKASDGSCDAAVGGYGTLTDVSVASAYKLQVSDPNQSGAPSSTSHKKITSPGSGSKCTSPEDIGGQAHDSRECAAVCSKTQTGMDWNWHQKTEPDDGNVMKEESQPDSTELEIQELENEIQGLVASPSFEYEDVRSEKLVADGLYLFPDVGPPSVLAYHPESKQLPPGYDPSYAESSMGSDMDVSICEFCQMEIKPFVTREQLNTDPSPEHLFCCEMYHMMWMETLDKEEALQAAAVQKKINIQPSPPFKSKQEKITAKERAAQKMREWELERYKNSSVNQGHFFSLGHQMKTISYRLSAMKSPDQEGMFPTAEEQSDIFTIVPRGLKKRHHRVLQKFYPSGKTFLTIFPDGTGNVFYPSGRVAVLISSVNAALYTYIIQEDCSTNRMQAVFTTRGQSTCYHPNGVVRMNLHKFGGSISDERGTHRRSWSWLDWRRQNQAAPFKPLFLSLNPQTSIHVFSQEQVVMTFAVKQNSVKFNMGTRLKLKDPSLLRKPSLDVHRQELKDKTLQIYNLLEKIRNAVKYPHRSHAEKIPSQYNLTAQIQRPEEKAAKKHKLHPSTKAAIKQNCA